MAEVSISEWARQGGASLSREGALAKWAASGVETGVGPRGGQWWRAGGGPKHYGEPPEHARRSGPKVVVKGGKVLTGREAHAARPRRESVRKVIGIKRSLGIAERDHHRCMYCEKTQEQQDAEHRASGKAQMPLQLDHLVARVHGGEDKPENLVTACAACNRDHGDKPVAKWLESRPDIKITAAQLFAHARKPLPGVKP